MAKIAHLMHISLSFHLQILLKTKDKEKAENGYKCNEHFQRQINFV